jgi:hypothetical protein
MLVTSHYWKFRELGMVHSHIDHGNFFYLKQALEKLCELKIKTSSTIR